MRHRFQYTTTSQTGVASFCSVDADAAEEGGHVDAFVGEEEEEDTAEEEEGVDVVVVDGEEYSDAGAVVVTVAVDG